MSDFISNFNKYNIPLLENGVRLPEFKPTPQQYKDIDLSEKSSNIEFLSKLCKIGMDNKIINKVPKEKYNEYFERCNYELNTIEELGFTDYILMIWDICDYGNKNNIPRGPGRGSVCSSLACFLCGITEIDAIEHGTLFTRFLNKIRGTSKIINGIKYISGALAPDIDQDQDYFRRSEIINYINEKYHRKTCKLLTTSTLTSKILIKDVLKTFEESTESEANEVSNLLEKEFGVPQEISDALENNSNFKEWAKNHKETCEIACKLSGLTRSFGQHASAILVSYDNIDDLIPLQLSSTKDIISGFDMYSACEIALKIDELGLKTVSLVNNVCKLINIKANDIDIHHSSIYKYLENFQHSYGIFQFETDAQKRIVQNIKPKNFKQIVDSLAISRPGASSFLGQYIDYVHRGIYKTIHPLIDPILKETGGVCLFQESLLKMLNAVGMDLENCELLRRAIGKKEPQKIKEYKEKIYQICKDNNHPLEVADLIWKIAEESAGYQFALSHSTAYAKLCCQTLYLKANYPCEFYISLLEMAKEESDTTKIISEIVSELNYLDIKLLPPHIILSDINFKIEGPNIRMGMGAIRGVSDKAIEKLLKFKHEYSSKFEIFQGSIEAELPANIMSALILVGCIDNDKYQISRNKLLLEYHLFKLLTGKDEQKYVLELGEQFGFDLIKILKHLNKEKKNDKGKPIIKDSRIATIKKRYQPFKEIYEQNKKSDKLSAWYFEKFLLGYSYSTNLLEIYKPHCPDLTSILEANQTFENEPVCVIGEVTAFKEWKSREKKLPCWKIELKDHTGTTNILYADSEKYSKIEEIMENNGEKPKVGSVVICRGSKGTDIIFGKTLSTQKLDIIKKISELDKKA